MSDAVAKPNWTELYFPPKGEGWETVSPVDAGFDPALLAEAIQFSQANESDWPVDIEAFQKKRMTGPWDEIVGPMRERGSNGGVIVREGRLVAEWGDTARADMTYSATKSYVSTCIGLAFDRDHARFGYLMLRNGNWDGEQLISADWIRMMKEPSGPNPRYGFMWWLNTDRELYPAAPESSFFALGAGSNVIWIDPDHDMVVVMRWIGAGAANELAARILGAIKQ